MKTNYTLSILAILMFASCSNESIQMDLDTESANKQSQTIIYPDDDGSTLLTGENSHMIMKILEKVPNYNFTRTLGSIDILDYEYDEIAAFTTELVKSCNNDKEKYDKIFKWITSNIKYKFGWVDNKPYAVFTTKEAICQGYADLLTVMLYSQNITCFTINGEVYQQGIMISAHAWNYVYLGKWFVSDPTNNKTYSIKSTSSYAHLRPTHINIPIFEDDYCKYNFFESHINVCSIKPGHEQIIIPFSVNNIRITSVCPSEQIPMDVKEIYIGKNITSLGVNIVGLNNFAHSVQVYKVDPENTSLHSFSNVIYKIDGSKYEMCVVSQMATSIELMPIEIFDKESKLKDLNNLETLIFSPGTKHIGAWTVEYCPRLHTAYIPEDTEVDSNAFVGVAENFKIVRGNYTNIPQIKY